MLDDPFAPGGDPGAFEFTHGIWRECSIRFVSRQPDGLRLINRIAQTDDADTGDELRMHCQAFLATEPHKAADEPLEAARRQARIWEGIAAQLQADNHEMRQKLSRARQALDNL